MRVVHVITGSLSRCIRLFRTVELPVLLTKEGTAGEKCALGRKFYYDLNGEG